MIGLNLADLGLSSDGSMPAIPSAPGNPNSFAAPKCGEDPVIVEGSAFARTLYHAWAGQTPCIILDSPPGAGKTSTVVDLAGMLAKNGLRVLVLTPTNRGGIDVASRIQMRWGDGSVQPASSGMAGVTLPKPYDDDNEVILADPLAETVTVRTVASASIAGTTRTNFDIVIVDEAYQTTYADVSRALTGSRERIVRDEDGEEVIEHDDDSVEQVVFVGDPEQIGPVVLDKSNPLIADSRINVSDPAPRVFAEMPGTLRLSLPSTYRLGEETTKIVNRFYDFDFGSCRPDMSIDGLEEINTMVLEEMDGRADIKMARQIAKEVDTALGSEFSYVNLDGQCQTRPLSGSDIAVVAAHNDQVSMLRSVIHSTVDEEVVVGTADSLQGGQWPLVIALDPLSGISEPGSHHFSLGRLCVMLSRHMSSLIWAYQRGWKTKIAEFIDSDDAASMHRRVRIETISASMEL